MQIFYRWPIITYLLLGLILWLGYQEVFPQRPQVIITDQQFSWALADWHRQHLRKPTEAERQQLLRQTIKEEVLYQQALADGLQNSAAVRARIQKLQSYLGESKITINQAEHKNSQQPWAEQDYITTDPVIRRFLVETAKQRLLGASKAPPFTDQQLRTYYQNHVDIYTTATSFAFHHIYFGGFEQHSVDRANEVLTMLSTTEISLDQAIEYGDAFYGGNYQTPSTQQRIQQQLGGGMGEDIADLNIQQWSGPIRSAYGWHLVYITDIVEKTTQGFAELREKISTSLRQEAQKKTLPKELEKLIQHYDIVVEISDP